MDRAINVGDSDVSSEVKLVAQGYFTQFSKWDSSKTKQYVILIETNTARFHSIILIQCLLYLIEMIQKLMFKKFLNKAQHVF